MINPIDCPECGSFAVYPTTNPDEDGLAEYRCTDCGHYFVDESTEQVAVPDPDLVDACEYCHGEGQYSIPTYPGSATVAKRTCRRCGGSGREPR